jgi:hypothetical protein
MSDSPRNWKEALLWFQEEQQKPYGSAPTDSGNWGGYCQMDARLSYAIPARDASAWAGWLAADDEDRHPGTDPATAPIGSALIWKGGSKGFGHIEIGAFPFRDETPAAWSNDLKRYGQVDKVRRTLTTETWGQVYVGYLTAINGFDLQLKQDKPPKPKQDKAYQRIDRAITNLEKARETARGQRDWADAKAITVEVIRLKKMYREQRHA